MTASAAFFDPWRPAARQYYTEKLEGPLWKNIKIEFSEAGGLYGVYPGVQLDAPELRWLWEAMEAGGKTVSFDLGRPGDGSYQTDQIASIAKRHPELKIVLCHMGQPSRAAERNPELWSAWLEQIRLGTLPNVWFDLSALPYHVQKEEEYPFPSTKRYFDLARGIVGAKKLLWGTDIPWLLGTANSLLAGGVDVMEITFRTAAAADSIKAVAESCPDMLVGAGTVITLEQCKKAVDCGAKFIVSPGFDEEVVRWCVENGVAVTPGCVTPTEIMAAMKMGLTVVKFFPAGVYGGLSAMKALSGPFGGIKFIPTGGVNGQNIGEFIAAPFIHAVGGSWVCPKADIAAGKFEKITELCKQARSAALGFEVAHIGVNCEDAAAASAVCEKLNEAFDLPVKDGSSSTFASSGIEVMKSMFKGKNGHIAIRTNSVEVAVAELAKKGFAYDESSAKYKNGRMTVAYLKDEFGGFAVHLLQK